jgi:peroxiredoxin
VKKVLCVVLLPVALAAVVGCPGVVEDPKAAGTPAPEITGADHDGETFSLSDPAYGGKVVMLDFWAGWCGPCRATFPHNKALVEKMKGRPFVLLGVNADYTQDGFRKAVRDHKLNWRSWWDEDGSIAEDYGVDAFPTIFLIDHKGTVRKKWRGAPSDSQVDAAVETLVKEAEQAKK